MARLVDRFTREATPLVTSAGVVAEWRTGAGTQVPIVCLLRRTHVVDPTYGVARILGKILGVSGTRDPVDAHVVLRARERNWPVLSSDAPDLHAIDPGLHVEEI